MSTATPPRPSLVPPATGSDRIDSTRLEALARRATTAAAAREPLEVEKPYTGELLGVVPRCTPDDVAAAVQRARAAQAHPAALPRPRARSPGRDPRPAPA